MTIAYCARYVFPVSGPPLEDGCVVVNGERIVAVGRNLPADERRVLGNTAILPGLVNAHTHLEFSDLKQPLGDAGMSMPKWIRAVIRHRRETPSAPDGVERGVAESIAAGTTALGEIAQPNWRCEPFRDAPLDAIVFLELLALSPQRVALKREEAARHCLQPGALGLSPHAPHTVHWDLLREAVALAQQYAAPLAFHLAESREELELLRSASGPFRELFDEMGVWVDGAIPCGMRPLDYLKQLAEAPRSLIVHGNYLDDAELDFLSAHANRMSVVYCPRTHAYFQHGEHPWRQMLARGINVAMGTDSRASNPDLSLLSELRFLAASAKSVESPKLLEMATLSGARALGVADQTGSIQSGKFANLTFVPLPDFSTHDPYELLLSSSLPSQGTLWRGIAA